MKKGTKRAWCKKKLRQLFTVLTNSNNARVETTSKTLQIVAVRTASAITPIIMVGPNGTDTMAKVEKTYTLLSKVALTLNKFSDTKEGRTAVFWISWMAFTKVVEASSLMVVPSLGTSAFAIAAICSAVYSIETIVGPDTFVGAEFINQANKWCAKGFVFLGVSSVLPKEYVIKLLESLKNMD